MENKSVKATTVATENMNEEDMLTSLTAEQLEDRKKVNTLFNTIEKAENQFLLNKFALAYLLITLRKKYKEQFWDVIDTTKVSQKTLERAMVLMLKDSVDFSQAMSNDGAEKDIADNVKLLVIDERVKALDMEALSKIYKPTLVKIANMKKLSDSDWKIMIEGSDIPYKEYTKAEVKKAADKKVEEEKLKADKILADKPDTMDTDIYLRYANKNKLFSIEKIAKLEKDLEFFKDILSKNNLLPKEDSELSQILTAGKLPTVSSESEVA